MHQILIFIKECNKKKLKQLNYSKYAYLGILDIKLPTY